MIEPLPFEITQGEFEGKKFDIKSHASPYDIQVKVNELVNAVNNLQTSNSHIQKDLYEMRHPEAKVDPYAKQRRWIGKLCWFSNGDGFDEVGYLTEIDPDMPEAKFRCNCHDYYEECKPVKPDDDIIYRGE